jgi:hypothetical protein
VPIFKLLKHGIKNRFIYEMFHVLPRSIKQHPILIATAPPQGLPNIVGTDFNPSFGQMAVIKIAVSLADI